MSKTSALTSAPIGTATTYDSISGSASSSDGESDGDAVAALVNKTRKFSRPSSPDPVAPTLPQMPFIWFHSPPSTQIGGVYRTLFSTSTPASDYLSDLKQMQSGGEQGRTWTMFITAGGHFAGAIMRVKRPDDAVPTKKGNTKRPKPDVEVLKRKTFRRYTSALLLSRGVRLLLIHGF